MKSALVVGMAKSGVASAKLLHQNGWHVFINDTKEEIPGLFEQLAGIPYENALGKAPEAYFDRIDLLVMSPGVSMFLPFVEGARQRGIEVIGEIELGYRYAKGDFLCITGTNGKTTCTALTGEICKEGERRTFVLGNIGTPLTEFSMQTKADDILVVETAALQLEGNSTFHAHVAAVCNIGEDHLDRFRTMDNYIAAKSKIFDNQTAADYAVLNYDDRVVREMRSCTPARVLFFSRLSQVEEGVFLRRGEIIYRLDGEEHALMYANEVRIPGQHNLENAMLCAAIGLAVGIPPASIAHALRVFPGVEHRIEFVCERKGVRYINDSKGTNPDSTIKAIAAMDRPTVLILGGYDKQNTFGELFEVMKANHIKAAVLLGKTADKLQTAAQGAGFSPIYRCEGDFQEAVDMASGLASAGDTVLLSPACASWDMFENFEQRGRVFKEIALSYKEE